MTVDQQATHGTDAEDSSDLLCTTPELGLDDLRVAAWRLGRQHMVYTADAGQMPLRMTTCGGVLVACVIVSRSADQGVSAVFVVKTGSSRNYLSCELLHKLGYQEPFPAEVRVMLEGEENVCRPRSTGNTNILGTAFLNRHCLTYEAGGGLIS